MKRKKIFISHKRQQGNATTDALLIKEMLANKTDADIFMDVTEDYLDSFPKTIKNQIGQSDIFILILAKSSNYDYLCDPDNWVHKEIHYALSFKATSDKPSRIVPVTFDRDFRFPSKDSLGDIADITDYSFLYYDTNNPDSSHRLMRALGIGESSLKLKKYLSWGICITLIGLLCYFILHISDNNTDTLQKYSYKETENFVTSLNRFDTFNTFVDSCGPYTKIYVDWYSGELAKNPNDFHMNSEFNEVYIREYCIRLVVLAYHAFTVGNLAASFDHSQIDRYINLCYDKIPLEARYPISLKQKKLEERSKDFDTILDVTIETLNSDPMIQSIDDSMLPILKSVLKSKLWPA